ncbi:MAG: glycoside hydrolase family 28 protein [Thermoguttaceae bacterium]
MNYTIRMAVAVLLPFWLTPSTIRAEITVDIRDCGAVGDGKTLCTAAIQKAIGRCADQGGGTVRVPAGTWLTGTVYLESNLTLVLDKDATLLGSRRHEDYAQPKASAGPNAKPTDFRYAAILAGSDLQNVTLRGEGTIDGQGDAFLDKSKRRPKNIYLLHCRNVTVEGLRLRNAGSWMQHYRHCDGLVIRKIDVFNHVAYNNDGLDVDSCSNVRIEDCRVDSDDDAIVIKSLSRDPCRNIVIRNCTVSSHCNAIKAGTESGGGFREMEVTNCTVHSPQKSKVIYGRQRGLAGIALEIVDGGTLDKVTVSNVRIDGVTVPVFLRLGNRARADGEKSPKPGVGTFQNVVLREITAENVGEIGCAIAGLPEHPIKDVVLENLRFRFEGGGTKEHATRQIPERPESYPEGTMFGVLPAYGFYCRHAEGLVFRNVSVCTQQPDLRPAMVFDDVKRLTIDSLEAGCASGALAVLRLVDVDGAEIRGCKAATADPFLLLEGQRTRQIVARQNDLSRAAKAVGFGPGVARESLSTE